MLVLVSISLWLVALMALVWRLDWVATRKDPLSGNRRSEAYERRFRRML